MRWLVVFLLGAVLGAAGGTALGLFLFPFVFPPPAAMEELRVAADSRPVATGTFIHANPNDPIHYGSGGLSVYEDTVFLHDDFVVGPGPKFHLYLVPRDMVRASADLAGEMFVDLGQLKAFKGSQNYTIPEGLDLTQYRSVVIWCEHFSVLISPADLDFATES